MLIPIVVLALAGVVMWLAMRPMDGPVDVLIWWPLFTVALALGGSFAAAMCWFTIKGGLTQLGLM